MISSALVASLHYLALGLGLGSVHSRAKGFTAVTRGETAMQQVLTADNWWGIAALLWIFSGLLRAFAGLEKGTEFYLHSPLFLLKMGLFGLLFVLEMAPMIALIRWRIRPPEGVFPTAQAQRYALFSHIETGLLIAMVFVASLMARGIGLNH